MATTKTNQLSVISQNAKATGTDIASAVSAESCFGLRFLGFTDRYCMGKLLELNKTLQLKGQIYNPLL